MFGTSSRALVLPLILAIGQIVGAGVAVPAASAQDYVVAPRDHMIMDVTGAYAVLWNGPYQLDVIAKGVAMPPIPIVNLYGRGWQHVHNLPFAVLFDGQSLYVAWHTGAERPNDSPECQILRDQQASGGGYIPCPDP
jgi:hypothetical protein